MFSFIYCKRPEELNFINDDYIANILHKLIAYFVKLNLINQEDGNQIEESLMKVIFFKRDFNLYKLLSKEVKGLSSSQEKQDVEKLSSIQS